MIAEQEMERKRDEAYHEFKLYRQLKDDEYREKKRVYHLKILWVSICIVGVIYGLVF